MDNQQKKKFTKIETSEKEFDQRLRAHRHKVIRLVALGIAAVLLIICLIMLFLHFRTYKGYAVEKEINRTDKADVQYKEFGKNLLKYSRDGAFLVDNTGKLLWNQTYEMNDPMVNICKNYVAIASGSGNEVYLADNEKTKGKIDTPMAIRQIAMAAQGSVAVLMEEDEDYYITLYDIEGTALAHGEFHMEKSGVPLTMAISDDCKNLAIAFLDMTEGVVKTTVHFYNFSDAGQEEIDSIVGKFSYPGEMAVQMDFFDNNKLLLYTDQKAIIYNCTDKPKEEKVITYPGKVQSIIGDDKYWGFTCDYDEKNKEGERQTGHALTLYNMNGEEQFRKNIAKNNTGIELLENHYVVVKEEKKCTFFDSKGVEKFKGSFDEPVEVIKKLDTNINYQMILETKIIEIKMK
jgi:hypothetical protein